MKTFRLFFKLKEAKTTEVSCKNMEIKRDCFQDAVLEGYKIAEESNYRLVMCAELAR